MSHQVTILCDNCDSQYLLEEEMEIPPYWIGIRIVIANEDGLIPIHEREQYDLHFCQQSCAVDYMKGDSLRERICMVDKEEEEEEDQ